MTPCKLHGKTACMLINHVIGISPRHNTSQIHCSSNVKWNRSLSACPAHCTAFKVVNSPQALWSTVGRAFAGQASSSALDRGPPGQNLPVLHLTHTASFVLDMFHRLPLGHARAHVVPATSAYVFMQPRHLVDAPGAHLAHPVDAEHDAGCEGTATHSSTGTRHSQSVVRSMLVQVAPAR